MEMTFKLQVEGRGQEKTALYRKVKDLLKNLGEPDGVTHTGNTSIWRAEAGGAP